MADQERERALRWAAAAAAGLSLMGCGKPETSDAGSTKATSKQSQQAVPATSPEAGTEAEPPRGDAECCIGKNECRGKGGCAIEGGHSCAGKNDCKGKGGCNMNCPK